MPKTKPIISIVNVVVSATIEQRLDLNTEFGLFPVWSNYK